MRQYITVSHQVIAINNYPFISISNEHYTQIIYYKLFQAIIYPKP